MPSDSPDQQTIDEQTPANQLIYPINYIVNFASSKRVHQQCHSIGQISSLQSSAGECQVSNL